MTMPRPRTAACGRWRGPRRCRSRAAPAGRASRRTARRAAPRYAAVVAGIDAARPLFAGQRDVEALDVEREADRGQRPPERAEQLVVAAAAADRHPVGGVVDLEHRARVVAEVAHQAEIEDHARGHAPATAGVDLSHTADCVVQPAGEPVEHLGAAARAGRRSSIARPPPSSSPATSPRRRRSRRRPTRRGSAHAHARVDVEASSSDGYSDESPSPTR